MQKRVPLVVLGLAGELLGAHEQRLFDVEVDEAVDDLHAGPEVGLGDEGGELGEAHDEVLDALGRVECFGEFLLWCSGDVLVRDQKNMV